MNIVKVVPHPKTGKTVTESVKSPGFGTVRLDSESITINNGFADLKNRTAFVKGRIEVLVKLFAEKTTFPGKIIRKTSSSPFYDGQEPVINPETAEVVLRNGVEYFQQYVFTQDPQAVDHEVIGD